MRSVSTAKRFNSSADETQLIHIAKLTDPDSVGTLVLTGRGITDKSADSIAKMKNLQILMLRGTSTTLVGRAKMKELKPGLFISAE